MAIQAQMYPENLGLPISSQDWLFMAQNNNGFSNGNVFFNGCGVNDVSYNNLQQKLQQQQLQDRQQELVQQHYVFQNLQEQRNTPVNNDSDSFLFVTPTKKQKLATAVATATARTTASTVTSESGDNHISVNFLQSFYAELEKQRLEIDRYISVQNERLRLALQEQRNQLTTALINRFEERATILLRQKDDEIAGATKKTMELQEIMRKMELERQAWQRVATVNGSMVINLNNTLEQLQEQQQQQQAFPSPPSNDVNDATSCCNIPANNNNNKGKEVICVAERLENNGETTSGPQCKVCKSKNSCMLLLPCKHLCCCKGCEVFLDVCPVCKLAKVASIEALIS